MTNKKVTIKGVCHRLLIFGMVRYIKTVTVKMFPNEEAYTLRLENYRKRYTDNDLCISLEELYKLYYQIAKEENCERSDDEIEQMLKAMSIYSSTE